MQIQKTARYLEAHGFSVTIGSAEQAEKFDLIHFWGLSPMESLYPAFARAARSGRRIVLSPVYWDLSRYYAAMGSVQRLGLWNRQRPLRREIATRSARIFVSGRKEAESLERDVGAPLSCTAVPCGIDRSVWGEKPDSQRRRPGILCAARISPRKNQTALARQCAIRRIPLLLAGPPGNPAYLERCLQFPNVRYAGALPPRQLAALFREFRIHALTGYAETPGLASLEAAACGCEIVTTDAGTAGEYFGEDAFYCDPYVPDSIGAALDAAADTGCQPRLRDAILSRFSWENCLLPLREAYENLP